MRISAYLYSGLSHYFISNQSRVLKLGGDKISTRALVLGTNSTTAEETQINNLCKTLLPIRHRIPDFSRTPFGL
jgi:hypothetical protein